MSSFLPRMAASLVAIFGLLAASHAGDPQLGFSLYGMKALPLEQALQVCAENGYGNVELALNAGYPTEPKLLDAAARAKLRETLKARGLTVSALMLNMSLAADEPQPGFLAALKEAAQLAHDLQPDQPPMIETVLGGKPAEWEALKEGMVTRLRAWARAAEEAKVQLAIKAHIMSAVQTPERLAYLLEQVPSRSIVVAFDYSHFEPQGIALDHALNLLLPRTRFIHVKDVTGTPPKTKFLLPGEGKTDYPAYFRLLRQMGYTGPIVVEVSAQVFNQPGYDPLLAAKTCAEKLKAALQR